nr:tyrosine-type recombinase/integrase [Mucilaginibacter corticis]
MGTGFSAAIEDWNEETDYPQFTHPKYKELSKRIDKIIEDINFEIKLAEKAQRFVMPVEIKNNLTSALKINLPADKPNKIIAYIKMVECGYKVVENPGYAAIFYNCRLTVRKLLNDKDKMFLTFTKADHEAYENQFLGLSESTKSNYLRTYCRIWNLAIADGLVTKDHHPKQYFKFKVYKRVRTKKRSIKADYWKRILKLKPAPDTRIYRSHLMAQFMYYARGMNFNDMIKLKWTDIQNNGVAYKRSKNKRSYDFELHPKAQAVLNLLREYPVQSDSGHVFPILMKEHDDVFKIDARIDSALKDFNEDSQAMADAIGWKKRFTSNCLRHGFASHLNEARVDIRIIQESLGHETQLQTRTYLDDIEDGPLFSVVPIAIPAQIPGAGALKKNCSAAPAFPPPNNYNNAVKNQQGYRL